MTLFKYQRKRVVLVTRAKVIMPELRTISFQFEETAANICKLDDTLSEKFLRTWRLTEYPGGHGKMTHFTSYYPFKAT
jgi:hypothetical protein